MSIKITFQQRETTVYVYVHRLTTTWISLILILILTLLMVPHSTPQLHLYIVNNYYWFASWLGCQLEFLNLFIRVHVALTLFQWSA